eukprot:scaffold3980_cov348-Prasinococcus_capsulatus_cf.AAC.11
MRCGAMRGRVDARSLGARAGGCAHALRAGEHMEGRRLVRAYLKAAERARRAAQVASRVCWRERARGDVTPPSSERRPILWPPFAGRGAHSGRERRRARALAERPTPDGAGWRRRLRAWPPRAAGAARPAKTKR